MIELVALSVTAALIHVLALDYVKAKCQNLQQSAKEARKGSVLQPRTQSLVLNI
jgi:hypothetical protein